MGSATTQALEMTRAALDATSGIDLGTAGELFAAARVLADESQLRGALADWGSTVAARGIAVSDVFGKVLSAPAVALLTAAVQQRWSSASDLVDGVDELAVRAAVVASPDAKIESELFEFSRTIAANPELELALGSRMGRSSAKGVLADALLKGTVSDATALIVASLVQQPGERRVRQLLTHAERIVADQRGTTVATVVTAVPLDAAQVQRLAAVLSRRYGSRIALNTVVDPAVVGGLRVQVADDLIDASVSSRLADLRLRLVG